MRTAMATSSASSSPRHDNDAGVEARGVPVLWGPRMREHLLRKSKRRATFSLGDGGPNANHLGYGQAHQGLRDLQGSSLLGANGSPFTVYAAKHVSLRRFKPMGSGLFRRYDAFPVFRYRVLHPLRGDEQGRAGCPHAVNGSTRRRSSRPVPFVAFDTIDQRHVLLTSVPKSSASGWQIDHVHRVMLTLSRGTGFQRLLEVWEHDGCDVDNQPQSWVFVQDLELSWIPLDLYCDAEAVTEITLRHVTFDVVSMVHFLHTHHLSASGQLCASQDFMVNVDTQRVVWLVSPSLVLGGCLLAHATPSRRERDVSSIGYLMFHLSMIPHATALIESIPDLDDFDLLLQEHLSHLSTPCRSMMLCCLTEKPAIEALIKRKWLRQVDFVSFLPRLDHHIGLPYQQKRLALHSLLWKLSTFFMVDWLGTLQPLGAIPSATATASAHEEEEVDSTRRSKKMPTKRQYLGRHVSISAHHYNHHHHHHHSSGNGRASGVASNLLMRGMIIVPPLGTAIVPHSEGDVEEKYNQGQLDTMQARAFVLRGIGSQLVPGTEDAIFEVSAKATSDRKTPYDSFGYDFPASPSTVASTREYDAFDDLEDDILAVEALALDEKLLEDGEGRRGRVSSLLLHENGHNHSIHSISSISDLRNVVRSLHHSSHGDNFADGSDERTELQQFNSSIHARASSRDGIDPVHLSAFGPRDIAYRDSFRIDIWAYLRQQRQEMLETALELNESEVAQRVQPMKIARGTLITVSIEPNDRFAVAGDECKSFRWRGDVNGVSFEMQRKNQRETDHEDDENDVLCIARIVAGTKVSLLFIRLQVTPRVSGDASSPAPLSTRLEHLVASVPDIPANSLEALRPIGKGAFGEAVLAIWKDRNTHVVVKSPHRDAFQADNEALDDFRHEAAVMQMLGKHPHVVELLGITSTASEECPAIVTEYQPNGSLHDFLATSDASHVPSVLDLTSSSSPLSLFSRTVMARDAAHGIVNIHQGHVLHRDIAARNCLLDDNYRVKVCDFGMSRLSSKASNLFFDDEHHGFGPIKWMAPESVLPPHLFSTHSDSYMFGVLMFEIFSGQLPFPGTSSRDAMALILEGQHVPIPEYLPRTHQQLMKNCFDPHPLARPSMDQIYMTLDQWILQDTRYHSRVPVGIL